MTCAWMETSRAETGSSQNDQLRIQNQRPRHADPLPLAAAELMGVPVDRVRGSRPTRLRMETTRVLDLPGGVRSRWTLARLADEHSRLSSADSARNRGPDRPCWILFLNSLISPAGRVKMFLPSKITSPAVGSMARIRILETVVFPHPLSPTRPRVFPRWTSRSIPSTASTAASDLEKSPFFR